MSKIFTTILLGIGLFIFNHGLVLAADCQGPWQHLPNYTPGNGYPCQLVGLDSNKGTCQPGQQHETLCDDASGGRYRTCLGARRCENFGGRIVPGGRHRPANCQRWDYDNNKPCPPGYINRDCKGGCGRQ